MEEQKPTSRQERVCLGIWVRTYTLPGEVWVRVKARGEGRRWGRGREGRR